MHKISTRMVYVTGNYAPQVSSLGERSKYFLDKPDLLMSD